MPPLHSCPLCTPCSQPPRWHPAFSETFLRLGRCLQSPPSVRCRAESLQLRPLGDGACLQEAVFRELGHPWKARPEPRSRLPGVELEMRHPMRCAVAGTPNLSGFPQGPSSPGSVITGWKVVPLIWTPEPRGCGPVWTLASASSEMTQITSCSPYVGQAAHTGKGFTNDKVESGDRPSPTAEGRTAKLRHNLSGQRGGGVGRRSQVPCQGLQMGRWSAPHQGWQRGPSGTS